MLHQEKNRLIQFIQEALENKTITDAEAFSLIVSLLKTNML